MLETVDTLILGATFAGISLHLQQPRHSLVLERAALPGTEYADSLNEYESGPYEPETPLGRQLAGILREDGFISEEGDIDPMAAVYALCGMAETAGARIRFMTAVTDIRPEGGGWLVVCHAREGRREIRCRVLWDTRARPVGRSLNALLAPSDALRARDARRLHRNVWYPEPIYTVPLEREDSYAEARRKLYGSLDPGSRVLFTANITACRCGGECEERGPGYRRIPSCGMGGLLRAFDRGGMLL